MKYKILNILTLLVLGTASVYGQKTDSLLHALKYARTDSQRVEIHQTLAWSYKDQHLEKADEHIDQGIKLSEANGLRAGLAKSYKIKGVIALYKSDMEGAKKYFQEALLNFKLLNNKAEEANTLNNLGMYWQMVGDMQESFAHFESAALIREEIGDKEGMANSRNNLGVMYHMSGNYEQSLRNHIQALKIWEEIGDQDHIAASYLNLGAVYRILDQEDEALKQYQKGLDISTENGNQRGMADAHSNLGDVWLSKKDHNKALENYLQALSIRERLADKTGIRESLSSIGEVYADQGNFHESASYHQRALHISQTIGDKMGILYQYNELGEVMIYQQKPDESLSYLLEGIILAKELEAKPELAKAFEQTTAAYAAKDDYRQAYNYQKQFIEVKDEMFNDERAKIMEELKSKYEVETKEKEIALLRKDNSIYQLQQTRLIVGSLAILLGAIAWLMFYRYRVQSKTAIRLAIQKREIEDRNHALEMTNADLEQFAYVASHDLKQPLRTIGSYAGLIARRYQPMLDEEGQEFISYVTEGVERMHGLLTDLLSYSQTGREGEMEAVDLNEIVRKSLKGLDHAIREKGAIIDVDPLPCVVANPVGMSQLFQNLISNAIKFHGDNPPFVNISTREYDEEFIISIQDNGIGIDPSHLEKIFVVFQRLHTPDVYPGTGIGLAICQKVVRQHGGDIWVDSEPGKGATFNFSIPKVIEKVAV